MRLNFNKKTITSIIIIGLIVLVLPFARLFKIKGYTSTKKAYFRTRDAEHVMQDYQSLSFAQKRKFKHYLRKLKNSKATVKNSIDMIDWSDAYGYIGETITVEGIIVRTYNSGKACFLNFHEDYNNSFSIVIFPEDFDKFPKAPEDYYINKQVRVRGFIREYKGAPEIILREVSNITVVE